MDVHLGAHGADRLDVVHQFLKVGAVLGPNLHVLVAGPLLVHDGLGAARQGLVDFLGNERHEGVQQLQRLVQHIDEHLAGGVGGSCVLAVQAGLADLDIPVAVDFPDEVLDLLGGQAQLVLVEVCGGLGGNLGKLTQNPLVAHVQQVFGRQARLKVLGQVHLHKTGSVPQLVGKVAAGEYLFVAVTHIIAGGGADDQHHAQSVRAVLLNDFQRVNAVAQRFRHLAALAVTDNAVDEHRVKRCLAGVGEAGENHAGNPEADDVVAGDEGVGGVEVVVILGVLVGPAQGGERPQRTAEPSVQRVRVLGQFGAAALGAGAGSLFGNNGLAAVVAVPSGDLVAPPQLAADAPVAAALHPVDVVLGEALGHELDLALLDALNGRLCQRLHLDEPLFGDHRLNDRVAAVAGAHVVGQRLGLFQRTAGFQVSQDGLAGFRRGHAGIFAAV